MPTGIAPQARAGHSAVLDTAKNQMIIFGGSGGNGGLNDTWSLNISGNPSWTQWKPFLGQLTARGGHSAVYDNATSRMTIFGGGAGICLNDTYLFFESFFGTGPVWTQLGLTGGPPAYRSGHSAVYDPASDRMTVFGGACSIDQFNDVWVLTNANGGSGITGAPSAWIQLAPSGGPPAARSGHTAVYDSASNRMIVFGGYSLTPTLATFNDLWILSNANGLGRTPTWTQLSTAGVSVQARSGGTAVYDAGANVMTVFGGSAQGENRGLFLNDTWSLLNANGLNGPIRPTVRR